MKIMEIKLSKLQASLIIFFCFLATNLFAEVRESRALVVASQKAVLSSELAAKIDNIPVKEMDRFKKGDLLIQFDCSLYEAQKDVVNANANSALIKVESDQQMFQMRTIGKYDLELSKSEYEKAKAELLIAELNLKHAGDALIIEMVVSSEWVSWLTIGQPIVVFIDEIKKEFNATVSGIGANVDPVSQTIQLKGTIIDVSPALLAGMSGRVIF